MDRPPVRNNRHFPIRKRFINTNNCQTWHRRFRRAIKETFSEYTKRTKVSGVWLLRPTNTHGTSRWLWSTILINLFLLGWFLSLQLWLKFYSYPILNTISSDLPITDVAFPGVTICSPKVVNSERVERYIKELYIPPEYDPSVVADGLQFINAFTDQNWEPPNHINSSVADEVLRLNNVSIYEASLKLSAGCDDFVKACFWGVTEFPCRQKHEYLSFIPTTSYLGPCCSFNYNPRNTSFVPFSSGIFGIDGGLTFIGVEGSTNSTGLIVLVHHPMDFTTEAAASVVITSKSESFVEILPTVQSSSIDVLELSQQKRDCLTSDDLELYNYRQAACTLSCEGAIMIKTCGCHPYHLPTVRKDKELVMDRECKLKDTTCYSKNYDKFKSVRCNKCLPNCYDVTYSTLSYKTDLGLHNYSVSTLYSYRNFTEDTFIVRVYLAKQVVPSIRKVTVMSWISLLADLGGVFNLCLGLSVVSLVEFFYYCTYRLYKNYDKQESVSSVKTLTNIRKY